MASKGRWADVMEQAESQKLYYEMLDAKAAGGKSPYIVEENKDEKKDTKTGSKNPVIGQFICFTIFAEADGLLADRKPTWKPEEMHYLIFQEEKSPSTGKHHYQGYVEFKNKMRLLAIQSALNAPKCHIERRMAKNGIDAANYCRKRETAINNTLVEYGAVFSIGRGYRTDIEKPALEIKAGRKLRDVAIDHPVAFAKYSRGFKELEKIIRPEIVVPKPKIILRPWQEDIIKSIENMIVEDRRKGWWVWSEASATGKTTTMKYLQATMGTDNVAIGDFRWDDLVYAYDNQKAIVFNIARGQEMNDTHYTVLEKATDGGTVLSRKYESRYKFMNAIIIVFANMPPPHKRQPERWLEVCLDPPKPKAEESKTPIEDLPDGKDDE